MRVKLSILLILVGLTACKSSFDMGYVYEKYTTNTIIELDTIVDDNQLYIYYENPKAIISLSFKDFSDYAKEKLEKDSLCNQKKEDLISVLRQSDNDKNLFFIEGKTPLKLYKQLKYRKYRKYKKEFIEPYGYETALDTTKKVKIEKIKELIISDKVYHLFRSKVYHLFGSKVYQVVPG